MKACHQVEAFPTFSSLEKHFRTVHHSKRIEYVCAFRGPMCCRNPKHDLVRNHCRNAGQHRRIPKPVKMAQTEHMPWMWAVNPDYVEVCNIPPLPKNPVGGRVLDPTPKPLAFASVYPVANSSSTACANHSYKKSFIFSSHSSQEWSNQLQIHSSY